MAVYMWWSYLKVSGENVKELVDEPSEEFTTKQLQDIHLQVQQMADEEVSSDDEGKTGENAPSTVD